MARGLEMLFSRDFKDRVTRARNPYEGERPSKKVRSILRSYPLNGILKKSFYDIEKNGKLDE